MTMPKSLALPSKFGGMVKATATVTNRMAAAAPMVILDLPIPGGFAIDSEGSPPFTFSQAQSVGT
jgi:hypothetical protein